MVALPLHDDERPEPVLLGECGRCGNAYPRDQLAAWPAATAVQRWRILALCPECARRAAYLGMCRTCGEVSPRTELLAHPDVDYPDALICPPCRERDRAEAQCQGCGAPWTAACIVYREGLLWCTDCQQTVLIPVMPGHKLCRGFCAEVLPLDEFPRDRTAADGRRNVCKVCHKEAQRGRRAARKGANDGPTDDRR